MEQVSVKPTDCDVCSSPVTAEKCATCGSNTRVKKRSAKLTMAFSLTALIFYFPANIFPFMTMELYGNTNTSTIWQGVVSLADSGSWILAVIVFLASILIPAFKLIALLYLSTTIKSNKRQRFKTRLYRYVEVIGRWSMLDIFLLAIFVAIMKLGHWTSVTPEIGSVLFAFVVIFTLLASANFDAKLIWENSNEN